MSVLIKGMDMPQNIGVIVTIYPDGHVDKMADSFGGKTEQFKAVPVLTPHGRLIDADDYLDREKPNGISKETWH